jgi:ubiquinone/menaquinone biosynthesis C-methylase UbiE
VNDDELRRSWSALSPGRSRAFLRTEDSPSTGSRELLADVLRRHGRGKPLALIDVGCGNGQLYEFFRSFGLDCAYTGIDYSDPLLDAARAAHADDPSASFLVSDAATLSGVEGHWDVAIFSHVIEMLAAPEDALRAARRVADAIAIRFFEPPEFETDVVELRHLDVGEGRTAPYIRRKMSRDYYRLILARIGCRSVDVYQETTAKDQVHLLHF